MNLNVKIIPNVRFYTDITFGEAKNHPKCKEYPNESVSDNCLGYLDENGVFNFYQ